MAKINTINTTSKNKYNRFNKVQFKKNWKKLSYLGLSGFLLLASFSYGGWSYFQYKSASAFSWKIAYQASGQSMLVCNATKQYVASWTLRYNVSNSSKYTMSVRISTADLKPGGNSVINNSYGPGQVNKSGTRWQSDPSAGNNPYVTIYVNGYRVNAFSLLNIPYC